MDYYLFTQIMFKIKFHWLSFFENKLCNIEPVESFETIIWFHKYNNKW